MGAGDVTVEPELLVLGSALPVIDNRTPASGRSEESAAGDDDAVHAQYWIPGAGQMTWSGLPPVRVGEYVAEWRPRSNSWTVHSTASGVRDDLIPRSNRYTFIAGVLLGIAGGALIHFARSLVSAVFFVIAGCLFAAN